MNDDDADVLTHPAFWCVLLVLIAAVWAFALVAGAVGFVGRQARAHVVPAFYLALAACLGLYLLAVKVFS